MADVRIPYTFGRGQYRAKIITRYKDESNVTRTVESEPFPFTSNAKEYFTFETNPQIKIDLDTMEPLNTELVDEGQYKGLDYKIYDNGLAIVSGTQTDAIENANEELPWKDENVTYIYGTGVFCSGYVFWTSTCLELELGSCSFTTTDLNRFIGRTAYQYIGGISNIDITGITTLTYPLVFTTEHVDISGVENLYNRINSALSSGNITAISGLINFTVKSASDLITLNIYIPSSVNSASRLFGGGLVGGSVSIESDLAYSDAYTSMGSMSYPTKSVKIKCSEYILGQNISPYIKELTINCPVPSTITEFSSSFRYSNTLEELRFDFTDGMSFDDITSYNMAFSGCSSLKRVYAFLRSAGGVEEETECFNMENVTDATYMFYNCTALEKSGLGTPQSTGGILRSIALNKTISANRFVYGCTNLHEKWNVYIDNVQSETINLSGYVDNSGLVELIVTIDGDSLDSPTIRSNSSNSGTFNLPNLKKFMLMVKPNAENYPNLTFNKAFLNNTTIEEIEIIVSAYPNDDHKSPKLDMNQMCKGCTALKNVTINGSCFSNTTEMFDGCTTLEELDLTGVYAALPAYGAFGQIYAYNIYLNSNAINGCSAIERIVAPLNMYNDTYSRTGYYGATLNLPKTMYYNGTAYNSITDGNRVYTSVA